MPIFVWLRKDELNLSRNQGRVLPKLHCHNKIIKVKKRRFFEVNQRENNKGAKYKEKNAKKNSKRINLDIQKRRNVWRK